MIDDEMYTKQCCVRGCELLWDMGEKLKVFLARNWTRTCREERAVIPYKVGVSDASQ